MDGGETGEPLGRVAPATLPLTSLRAQRSNPAAPKTGLPRCARNDAGIASWREAGPAPMGGLGEMVGLGIP
jgi:hypothetical protein